MELLAQLLHKFKKGSYRAIFLALFCYLLYHLINSGMLLAKWPDKIKTLKSLTEENIQYEIEKRALELKISGLLLESKDMYMLDKKARYILGQSDNNEIIIYESKKY